MPTAAVIGAVVERDGKAQRIGARRGVVLATGGFDHDMAWRKQHLPDASSRTGASAIRLPWATVSVRARRSALATDLLDEAWWFPAIRWPDGRLQFMLNERMMPAQFVVNGAGQRFINEAAPYMDFAHAMIDGQRSGVTHIPCWLITDHPVLPPLRRRRASADPEDPVRAGAHRPEGTRGLAGVRCRQGGHDSWERLAEQDRRARATNLRDTAARFNELARKGHDDDFNRGDSVYDNYYGDPTLPNPNLHPLGKPPYYAFQIILGDLGTSGGLRTDEYARVLRADDSVVRGLYAVGNASAAVMGRSYAGAGRHHRAGHDLRLRRGQAHR